MNRNLETFSLVLRFGSEGCQQVSTVIENDLDYCKNKMYYFPSSSTQMYDWIRDPLNLMHCPNT